MTVEKAHPEQARTLTPQELSELFGNAVANRRCVQCWLGYADCLFLGLGEEIMPPPIPQTVTNRRTGRTHEACVHSLPPYELQTEMSSWHIDGPQGRLGDSDDDPRAKGVAEQLVGKWLQTWRFGSGSHTLHLFFAEGFTLTIEPYEEAEFCSACSWNLRLPTGECIAVLCSGEARIQAADVPAGQ